MGVCATAVVVLLLRSEHTASYVCNLAACARIYSHARYTIIIIRHVAKNVLLRNILLSRIYTNLKWCYYIWYGTAEWNLFNAVKLVGESFSILLPSTQYKMMYYTRLLWLTCKPYNKKFFRQTLYRVPFQKKKKKFEFKIWKKFKLIRISLWNRQYVTVTETYVLIIRSYNTYCTRDRCIRNLNSCFFFQQNIKLHLWQTTSQSRDVSTLITKNTLSNA